jgi:hypothetical protein
MTTNITTLALNLLISERLSHRNFLATKIVELLNTLNDYSGKGQQTKEAFISLLHQCIANPTCQFRDLFYRYSEYYTKRLNGQKSMSPAA